MNNHKALLSSCHEAFWSFPEETIGSDKRIGAVIETIANSAVFDRFFLLQLANRIKMPDIAMCNGDGCPVKEQCWRHVAPPDRWQSYFAAPPHKEDGCEYFWNIEEK